MPTAYCDDDGLIGFCTDEVPEGFHLIISGDEIDMAAVRELAHQDGNRYWVPGVRDGLGCERKLEAFQKALFCEDDGFTLYPEIG